MAFRSIPAEVNFRQGAVGTVYTTYATTSVPVAAPKQMISALTSTGARCIPDSLYRAYWRQPDAAPLYVDYKGNSLFASDVTQRDLDRVCRCVQGAPEPDPYAKVSTVYDATRESGDPGTQKRTDYCWSVFFKTKADGVYDPAAKQWLWQPAPAAQLSAEQWLSGMPSPCGGLVGSCYDASRYETQNYVQRAQQNLRYVEGSPRAAPYRVFFPVDAPGLPDPAVKNIDNGRRLLPGTDSSAPLYSYNSTVNPTLNSLVTKRKDASKLSPLLGLGELPTSARLSLVAGGVVAFGAAVLLLTRKGK